MIFSAVCLLILGLSAVRLTAPRLDFSLDRTVSQLAHQAVLRTQAVLRFGLLLLLCSPSLLLAGISTEELSDTKLVVDGDPALLITLWEHVEPLLQAEGEILDDEDKPPPWPGSASASRPIRAIRSVFFFHINQERLPDPAEYLQARLRAPPPHNPRF